MSKTGHTPRPPLVSRRKFLTLAGAASLGAVISACQGARPQPTAAPTQATLPTETPMTTTPTPAPTPTQAGKITLDGGPADVWAWQVTARGQVENLACSAVEIKNGAQSAPAAVEGKTFSAQVPVRPGENPLSAACAPGGQTSDPVVYTGRLHDVPTSTIKISISGDRILLDGSASQPAPLDPKPIHDFLWSVRPDMQTGSVAEITIAGPQELAGKAVSGAVNTPQLELTPPAEDGEYYLSLKVVDPAGRSDISTTYFTVAGGKPVLADWAVENTAWVENAVVYGVIPRKFGTPNAAGIAKRLDALQELGVTALWLAPIHPSPPGDYGYSVLDYFELREAFGTKADFRDLVQDAHKRGIRVMMDFVSNHSSIQHPYFQDAEARGKASHYWDFYDRDENGKPTHYFDWEHLPNLNYSNPEVEQWMLEAFTYWVREFDVDGFRVDACWGVKQRKPDFWPRWRAALKRIKPDLLLLAEASARDEYYFTDGFDAAYDWTDQLGHWAWENVFKKPTLLVYNLNAALTNNRAGYHPDALIFRFLNNNDTGGRFITVRGVPMAKVATTLLLTLPGIPCIYTGDEIGAEYTPYGDPQPLSWDKDPNAMFPFHQQLIKLRRETPALHARQWQVIDVVPEPNQQVYAYMRYTKDGGAPALVVLNFLEAPAQVAVEIPEAFAALSRAGKLRDLLSGESITAGKALAFEMPPLSARILTV